VLLLHDVEKESGPIKTLFREVREQLLHSLSPEQFADVYAQTMVYGLLAARISHPQAFKSRAEGPVLNFENPFLEAIYRRFRATTDDVIDVDELGLDDLAHLLAEADVEEILADFGSSNVRQDPVVHFYEEFLALYDPDQRIELGAFYTPSPIVRCMVRLADQALESDFDAKDGLASRLSWLEMSQDDDGVTIPDGLDPETPYIQVLDPATGTGTFLVEWQRHFATRLSGSEIDPGVRISGVQPQPTGLEISLPPYSVAQLRLALLDSENRPTHLPSPTVLLTDTMAVPEEGEFLVFDDDVIAEQAKAAARIKVSKTSTVVIGNPPYGDKSKGMGDYVEKPWGGKSALLDDFTPSDSLGLGRHLKILRNLYVFFWRFSADQAWLTPPSRPGVVSLITSAAWLTGPVFTRMREFLIVDAKADLWVIDLGGDLISGSAGDENVFPIRTPVAIVMAVRGPNPQGLGTVRRIALRGSAESKLQELENLQLSDSRWQEWEGTPGDPIGERQDEQWTSFPLLGDLMPFSANGIHQQRTWVNDASRAVLRQRWQALVQASGVAKPSLMKETRSRKITATGKNLATSSPLSTLAADASTKPQDPIRYSFRFFDRQWLIPDSRVIDRPSPELWSVRSKHQFFVNEMHSQAIGPGPGIVVAPFIPNLDHFKGNSGGRILPAWRDKAGQVANVAPGLVEVMSEAFGQTISPSDLIAYIVGLVSHRGFTERFSNELRTPGIRVPLTKNLPAFESAVRVGQRAIWIQTFGMHYAESQGAETGAAPRLAARPQWPSVRGVIGEDGIPASMDYDVNARTLRLGAATIENVPVGVYEYSVTGMPVLKKWFGYRKLKPTTKRSSALNDIVSTTWQQEWTDELIDVIHALALMIDVEDQQEEALDAVMTHDLLDVANLSGRISWPPDPLARKPTS
jgi:predicted helicase